MFALKGMWLFLRWNLHRDVSFSFFSVFSPFFFFFYDGSFLPLELKFFVGTPSCSPTFLRFLTLGTRRSKWTTKCSFSTTSLYIGRSNGRSSLYRNAFLFLWNSHKTQDFRGRWIARERRIDTVVPFTKVIFLVRLQRCFIPKRLLQRQRWREKILSKSDSKAQRKRVTVE